MPVRNDATHPRARSGPPLIDFSAFQPLRAGLD